MIGDTGKRRRSRIELGYYQTAGSILRGGGAGSGCSRFSRWRSGSRRRRSRAVTHARTRGCSSRRRIASKGPLAQPHAIWDSTCEACHVSFTPINGSRWAPAPWAGQRRGKQEVHGLPCRAGPPQNRAKGRRPRLCRVSPRPPRPRCVASGDGRLGVHNVSPEPGCPSRPGAAQADCCGQRDPISTGSTILTSLPPGRREPFIRGGSNSTTRCISRPG